MIIICSQYQLPTLNHASNAFRDLSRLPITRLFLRERINPKCLLRTISKALYANRWFAMVIISRNLRCQRSKSPSLGEYVFIDVVNPRNSLPLYSLNPRWFELITGQITNVARSTKYAPRDLSTAWYDISDRWRMRSWSRQQNEDVTMMWSESNNLGLRMHWPGNFSRVGLGIGIHTAGQVLRLTDIIKSRDFARPRIRDSA